MAYMPVKLRLQPSIPYGCLWLQLQSHLLLSRISRYRSEHECPPARAWITQTPAICIDFYFCMIHRPDSNIAGASGQLLQRNPCTKELMKNIEFLVLATVQLYHRSVRSSTCNAILMQSISSFSLSYSSHWEPLATCSCLELSSLMRYI